MKLGILKEKDDSRVAVIPETLPKLKDLGLDLLIEKGAGEQSMYSDEQYQEQGATVTDRAGVLSQADILLSISPPEDGELKQLPENTLVISQFEPFNDPEVTEKLRSMKLRAFSLDMIEINYSSECPFPM